jgi:hypothetical protein
MGGDEKNAWESEMRVELENVQITSYQLGVLDTDGRDFLTWQRNYGTADSDPNLLLPAVSDPNLLLPAVTDPNLLLPYTDFHIV